MAFLYNVITSAGANLIAQATAANPIVIIDCYAGNQAASSAEDLASRPLSFYSFGGGYSDGTIFSCSAQDNTARVMMNFNSGHCDLNEPEYIKSACIRGRLQSQSNSEAVIIAALSDSSSEIQIPSTHSPVVNIHLPINIIINADDQVATVGAEYSSLADLARFVSMYKAGNPNTGENQTIKGSKTFTGQTQFDDQVSIDSDLIVDNNIINNGDIRTGWLHSMYVISKDDNTYANRENPNFYGVALHESSDIAYGAYASVDDSMMSGVMIHQNSKYASAFVKSQVVIDNARLDKVIICDLFYEDDQAYIDNRVYETSNYAITSDYTDFTQGCNYYRWEIYKNNSNDGFRYEWDDEETEFCLMPLAGNTGSLGAETCRWSKGYFDSIDINSGYLPRPTKQTGSSGITTKIGSIVMIAVQVVSGTTPDHYIGTDITSSNNLQVYAGDAGAASQRYTNGYTFRALQTIVWKTNQSNVVYAEFLAMRVS
jgi:hypothetical protein